jgi:SAM-dependent methyltransferase
LKTVRAGHVSARALAIADSRAVVRSLFLASAVRIGLLDSLRDGPAGRGGRAGHAGHGGRGGRGGPAGLSFTEIAVRIGCLRFDRLRAWLDVGTELGEISQHGGRYQLHGRRARAIAAGDALLAAHYRSILEYQAGPYAELEALLRCAPGEGRADLDRYSDDIAQVSTAATPFIASYLTRVIGETHPARILDVGCGTAVYSTVAAGVDPQVQIDGIDLAESVIATARAQLRAAGLDDRIRLHTGDIRRWTPGPGIRYDLVLLLNNVYYFPAAARAALYRQLGDLLSERGHLVIASQTAPGSVASAHLNFMLTCQYGAAALPRAGELEADLASAGFEIADLQPIVPTEPFLAVRAIRLLS